MLVSGQKHHTDSAAVPSLWQRQQGLGPCVMCCNYHLLQMVSPWSRMTQIGWEVLVVDEGHRLKNADSRLVEALRGFTFHHRVLLTGTPLQVRCTQCPPF